MARYNKAIAALAMAILAFLKDAFGVELPISEGMIDGLLGLITVALVYGVGNKP